MTKSGRALVITLGFVSILAFTACIGAAAYVCLCIVDDALKRLNMRRLTKGWTAVCFWLAILNLWTLVIAGIADWYTRSRYHQEFDLENAYWFAFVSITTVGFGDYHIQHEGFRQVDMLLIPICLLIGFVLLANFLLKLSDVLKQITNKVGITDHESLNYLLSLTRRNEPSEEVEVGADDVVVANVDRPNEIAEFAADDLVFDENIEMGVLDVGANDLHAVFDIDKPKEVGDDGLSYDLSTAH